MGKQRGANLHPMFGTLQEVGTPDTETQKKRPYENPSRDWSYAATSQQTPGVIRS